MVPQPRTCRADVTTQAQGAGQRPSVSRGAPGDLPGASAPEPEPRIRRRAGRARRGHRRQGSHPRPQRSERKSRPTGTSAGPACGERVQSGHHFWSSDWQSVLEAKVVGRAGGACTQVRRAVGVVQRAGAVDEQEPRLRHAAGSDRAGACESVGEPGEVVECGNDLTRHRRDPGLRGRHPPGGRRESRAADCRRWRVGPTMRSAGAPAAPAGRLSQAPRPGPAPRRVRGRESGRSSRLGHPPGARFAFHLPSR
jgi:hypothetical protein